MIEAVARSSVHIATLRHRRVALLFWSEKSKVKAAGLDSSGLWFIWTLEKILEFRTEKFRARKFLVKGFCSGKG